MKVFIVTKVAGCRPLTLLKLTLSRIYFKNFAKITSLCFNKMVNKCAADKQNVPLALAVIHETTITAAESYFPNQKDVTNVLEIFNTC